MSPVYRYRATDCSGRKHKGNLSAAEPKELLNLLRASGLIVIDLAENRNWLPPGSPWSRRFSQLRYGKAGSRDFMIFCRQFATLIQAGMSALHALTALAGQMERSLFRRNLEQVAAGLAEGNSLAESFNRQSGFFPVILVHMVEAGETSGALAIFLERLAEHFEQQHDLEEKIRSATLYPLFITGVAAMVMVVMVIFVLPQFALIFRTMNLEMPLFASLILQGGSAVRQHWPAFFALLMLIAAGLHRVLSTEYGRLQLDLYRLRLPFFSRIYRQTMAARFTRMMGVLLVSGLNLVTALELSEKALDNRVLSRALKQTREAISQGQSMAEPLKNCNLFPPLLVEMIRVGEAGGALEEICLRTATLYERELAFTIARLGSMLEPVLLLLVGLIVGGLVFSILSPIYQVFQMI